MRAELRRRLRLLLRRFNLFSSTRTSTAEQANVSGPTVPRDTSGGGF